jgi:integrase
MLLDEFASYCWTFLPVTKKTIENYRGAYLRNISHYVGQREMSEITKREFLELLSPLTPPNYFQTLMATRVIYREAMTRDLLSESPVASIKAPRPRPRRLKFLTWDEVSKIDFGRYDENIKFLALHELRWGEAVALTEEDIYDEKFILTRASMARQKQSLEFVKLHILVISRRFQKVALQLRKLCRCME